MTPEYSIVVPIFNEEETLEELFRRLAELMERLDGPAEIVLVDDGSTDRSYPMMVDVSSGDPRFRVVQLSRNFGHQIAITAGLDYAGGNAVIVMDADLQDPPDVILEMARRWREGHEVVYAVRQDRRGESRFKTMSASFFYKSVARLTDVEAPAEVGDFRLVDRKALDAFRAMRENNRYVRGMFSWIGFNQVGVPYTREERYAGTTKYPLRKMLNFAVDAIVSFSNFPLRIALSLGFLLAGLAFAGGALALVAKLAGGFTVPGWASLVVAVSFLGGIQLMILGVMGEYVARIYDEVKNRPLYFVRNVHGFSTQRRPEPRRKITPVVPDSAPDVEVEVESEAPRQ